MAMVDYIRDRLQYCPGTGQQIISASEVNQSSQAVCRDMAGLCVHVTALPEGRAWRAIVLP